MMLAVSCNSFLDVVPDNRTLLDSPDAVKEILVSAYPQAHYYHICEVMSDNAQERKVSSTHSRATLNKQMYYWDDGTETTQDNPVYVWTNYYEAIAAANMALEAIEEAGDTDEYSTAKGEAWYVGPLIILFWSICLLNIMIRIKRKICWVFRTTRNRRRRLLFTIPVIT